jgi:putative transcription factor
MKVHNCELCGRKMKGRGRNVEIEGAKMTVCPQCATKFGGDSSDTSRKSARMSAPPSWLSKPERRAVPTPHRPTVTKTRPKPKPRPRKGTLLDDMMLIEDYAKVIRTARQKVGISQEELAQRVGERISTLQAIEAGRQKPNNKTIRGLERELGISLLEPIDSIPIKTSRGSSVAGPTLGDRVVVKRKKPKKSE